MSLAATRKRYPISTVPRVKSNYYFYDRVIRARGQHPTSRLNDNLLRSIYRQLNLSKSVGVNDDY